MRKPLYRAKAINREEGYLHRTSYKNGDWVYGLVSKINEFRGTITAEMTNEDGISGIDVDANTLCEFTGLCDKCGKKIFEGDIVGLIVTGSRKHKKYKVFFDVETGQRLMKNGESIGDYENLTGLFAKNNCVVIGNIYDNPELLEEKYGK